MDSHIQPTGHNGKLPYPPFNPNTASYTSADAQPSVPDMANPKPDSTLSTSTDHTNPEYDINGIGGMINLTSEEFRDGQRSSIAHSASLFAPVSNKRQLSYDQSITNSNTQFDDNGADSQTQVKKRARNELHEITKPSTTHSRVFVLGESVFSQEDFEIALCRFMQISAGHSPDDDDVRQVRDLLTWPEDEQRKWLAKLSPEQFAVVLLAEKQNHDQERTVVAQLDNAHAVQNHPIRPVSQTGSTELQSTASPTAPVSNISDRDHNQKDTQPRTSALSGSTRPRNSSALKLQNITSIPVQNRGKKSSTSVGPRLSNRAQVGNGVQNGTHIQHAHHQLNMPVLNDQVNLEQQFSPPIQQVNFQQVTSQHRQTGEVPFQSQSCGIHHGQTHNGGPPSNGQNVTFAVGPNGQFLPQQQVPQHVQQNMFRNMQSVPGYHIPNMQTPGVYQHQAMVNGQLMNISFRPVCGCEQNGNYNQQAVPSAHRHATQQHGMIVGHNPNIIFQQNPTASYGQLPSYPPNYFSQLPPFELPTLTHEAIVAEAQLRAATMRRQHAALRARGITPPRPANDPNQPVLMMSGPGLGALPGAINTLPFGSRTGAFGSFDQVRWGNDHGDNLQQPVKKENAQEESVREENIQEENVQEENVQEEHSLDEHAQQLPSHNNFSGHIVHGNGYLSPFSDPPAADHALLTQYDNVAIVNHTSSQSGYIGNTFMSEATSHNGINGTIIPSYRIQLPNAAGQLSIGPNAQGSTSPAGASNNTSSKSSPKAKKAPPKTPKKASKKKANATASSSTPPKTPNFSYPNSIFGPLTSQTIIGTAHPAAPFPAFQNPAYAYGSQANPINLDMPTPVSAVTRSAFESLITNLEHTSLPTPVVSPSPASDPQIFQEVVPQAAPATSSRNMQITVSSLRSPETSVPATAPNSMSEGNTTINAQTTLALLGPAEVGELATTSMLDLVDETTNVSASGKDELASSNYEYSDVPYTPITTPELEPSAPCDAATPEEPEPADFNYGSVNNLNANIEAPNVPHSGEFTDFATYDENQSVGLGFDMDDQLFAPVADVNFEDWINFEDSAQQ